MAHRCGSCGKQARLRRVQVDVTNRYGDELRFKVDLCGPCAVALCDNLQLDVNKRIPSYGRQYHMPGVH